jgi:hypothetical protein
MLQRKSAAIVPASKNAAITSRTPPDAGNGAEQDVTTR